MDCSGMPPTKIRHIPAEIVEEILSNLPVKSLLRFSTVSDSWNLMINEASFSKKYRGRERMIFRNPNSGRFKSCPLSAAISNNPIEESATDLDVFKIDQTILAVSDGLFCIGNETSLFLWNPSNRKFHKIPRYQSPPNTHRRPVTDFPVHYGLGYDSVGDDYKLLRIYNYDSESALYSLKSNSWRKIRFPWGMALDKMSWRSWSVSGKLHWLCSRETRMDYYVIVSFDLSKEEYVQMELPPEIYRSPVHVQENESFVTREEVKVEVVVLRGKVCLGINYWMDSWFVVWVMEDYGVAESWTKKFEICYDVCGSENLYPWLRVLCVCDEVDGQEQEEEAICVTSVGGESWVMWKDRDGDGNTLVKKNFGKEVIYRNDGFVYVESFVSPAALMI